MDRYEKEYSEDFLELLVAMLWVELLSLCQEMRLKEDMDT